MAEDSKKYPPIRATIVDAGWSVAPAQPQPSPPPPVPSPDVAAVAAPASLSSGDLEEFPRPLVASGVLDVPEAHPVLPTGDSSMRVGDVLGQRVRIFKSTVLISVLLGGAVATTALLTFAVLFFAWSNRSSPASASSAVASPSSSVVESLPGALPAPAAPPPTIRDEIALKALSEKLPSELSIEEAVVLTNARRALQEQRARVLSEKFTKNPRLVEDAEQLKEFKLLAVEDGTSDVTLRAMANLPGALAGDLLYNVWTSTANRSASTTFAQLLVYSKDVSRRASPALRVALDLRAAQTCEENHAVLPRAIIEGDRRSLHLLVLLQRKSGCGPKRKDDCYPCLRVGTQLAEAVKAVRARRAPTL